MPLIIRKEYQWKVGLKFHPKVSIDTTEYNPMVKSQEILKNINSWSYDGSVIGREGHFNLVKWKDGKVEERNLELDENSWDCFEEISKAFFKEIKQSLQDWKFGEAPNEDPYFDCITLEHKTGRKHYTPKHGFWGFNALRDEEGKKQWEEIQMILREEGPNYIREDYTPTNNSENDKPKTPQVEVKKVLEDLTNWQVGLEGDLCRIDNEKKEYKLLGFKDECDVIARVFLNEIKQNISDWTVDSTKFFHENPIPSLTEEQKQYAQDLEGWIITNRKTGKKHYFHASERGIWWKVSSKLKREWKELVDQLEELEEKKIAPTKVNSDEKDEPINYSTWTKEQLIVKIEELEKRIKELEQNNSQSQELVKTKEEIGLIQKRLQKLNQTQAPNLTKEPKKTLWEKDKVWFILTGGIIVLSLAIFILYHTTKGGKRKQIR